MQPIEFGHRAPARVEFDGQGNQLKNERGNEAQYANVDQYGHAHERAEYSGRDTESRGCARQRCERCTKDKKRVTSVMLQCVTRFVRRNRHCCHAGMLVDRLGQRDSFVARVVVVRELPAYRSDADIGQLISLDNPRRGFGAGQTGRIADTVPVPVRSTQALLHNQ